MKAPAEYWRHGVHFRGQGGSVDACSSAVQMPRRGGILVHVGRPPTIEAMAFAADRTVTPRRYTAKPDDVSAVLDRLRAGLIDGRVLL